MNELAESVELITDASHLARAVDRMAQPRRLAVDLESNGFHRYPERVCLVQIGVPGRVFLVDTLAIDDVSPLGKILADGAIEKIFHSADYDLRSLDREWGFRVRNLFDTSIAAAFVGQPRTGLEAVAEALLGIKLDKNKRLQRADWSLRPLSAEAQSYAAGDVWHLFELRSVLDDRLLRLGRREWVAEECQRLSNVRYEAPRPDSAFLSMKGSRTLDGRGLAVLKALAAFREREARRKNRPPFKVMSDAVLVELAARPETELAGVKGIGRYGQSPACKRLGQAIKEGLVAPAVRRPASRRGRDAFLTAADRSRAKDRLKLLKGWRAGLGNRLDLDPALLWPVASLARLAGRPRDFDVEPAAGEIREWQRREFEADLRCFLQGLTLPPSGKTPPISAVSRKPTLG